MESDAALGRDAYARRAWRDAYAHLSAAAREPGLTAPDLEQLAVASHLIGADDWVDRWAGVYGAWVESGAPLRAARCAGWLAYGLFTSGQVALGGGWLARAQEALDNAAEDRAERGWMLIFDAIASVDENPNLAHDLFVEAAAMARRHHDQDLLPIAQMGQGQALIARGDCRQALRPLDAAMLIVTTDDVSPLAAGVVFCGVIDACQRALELRRAAQWTAVLSRWCDAQPDLVPFRGQCLIHRAEVMQLRGDWDDAIAEARRAHDHLLGTPVAGEAAYRQGELYRLRGRFAEAEALYQAAFEAGRDPQPGLALLRLSQDQTEIAVAAIRRVLAETLVRPARVRMLGAAVDIFLVAGDVDSARSAADELAVIADALDVLLARAVALQARGQVSLAAGDAEPALFLLRRAWQCWRELATPYEAARARMLVGLACRSLGDAEAATMELDAARLGFAELGAGFDLATVELVLHPEHATRPGGLSAREVEVLVLVARGSTNREIAAALIISEHTVARHLQNILTKLGVTTRTAAAAFAHEHRLT